MCTCSLNRDFLCKVPHFYNHLHFKNISLIWKWFNLVLQYQMVRKPCLSAISFRKIYQKCVSGGEFMDFPETVLLIRYFRRLQWEYRYLWLWPYLRPVWGILYVFDVSIWSGAIKRDGLSVRAHYSFLYCLRAWESGSCGRARGCLVANF